MVDQNDGLVFEILADIENFYEFFVVYCFLLFCFIYWAILQFQFFEHLSQLFCLMKDLDCRFRSKSFYQRNEKKQLFCYHSHLPPEILHIPVVNRAAPITGTQLHFSHWQCCHDTLSRLHQRAEPGLGHHSHYNPLTQDLKKCHGVAQATKRKGRLSRTIMSLPNTLAHKLSISPAKFLLLSVSFQKRNEGSYGIVLNSLPEV